MLKMLGLFGGLTAGWWAVLWLMLPPTWQRISPSAILLLHVGPPFLLGVVGKLWAYFAEKRAQAKEKQQQEQADSERSNQREEARNSHIAALQERQQTVTCRWLSVAAAPAKEPPAWLDEVGDIAHWLSLDKEEFEAEDALSLIQPELSELLETLYTEVPGAAWLPIYMEPIPQLAGVEQLNLLKESKQQAVLANLDAHPSIPTDCRFLPGSGLLSGRVLQVLQQDPELPGVVVLAADAPLVSDYGREEYDEPDPQTREYRRWHGEPGMALVAMLFLRDELSVPDEVEQEDTDPYQPYWEKNFSGPTSGWGTVPPALQAALARLPRLADLARAVSVDLSADKSMQLVRQLQPVLDNALVNTALLDYPFSVEEANPDNNQANTIAWLCHNSGEIDVGGVRLAAIGTALFRHEADVHPIEQASNVVREWGDTGAATAALLTASAIGHCARLQSPVVITHFVDKQVTLAIVKPSVEQEIA